MTEVGNQSSCGLMLNIQGALEVETKTKCELWARKKLEMTDKWKQGEIGWIQGKSYRMNAGT